MGKCRGFQLFLYTGDEHQFPSDPTPDPLTYIVCKDLKKLLQASNNYLLLMMGYRHGRDAQPSHVDSYVHGIHQHHNTRAA